MIKIKHTAMAFVMINLFLHSDSFSQASPSSEELLKSYKSHASDNAIYFQYGVALINEHKESQAITVFEQLLLKNPNSPSLYNNLAVLYANQQNFDKTEELLKSAIRVAPNYPTAYENLADLYLKLSSVNYNNSYHIVPNKKLLAKIDYINFILKPQESQNNIPYNKDTNTTDLINNPNTTISVAENVLPNILPSVSKNNQLNQILPVSATTAQQDLDIQRELQVKHKQYLMGEEKSGVIVQSNNQTLASNNNNQLITDTDKETTKDTDNKINNTVSTTVANRTVVATSGYIVDTTKKDTETVIEKTVAPDLNQSVMTFVNNWKQSWETQNVQQYIAYYSPDYSTPKATHDEWLTAKLKNINSQKNIHLQLYDIKIEPQKENNQVYLSFVQKYQSNKTYSKEYMQFVIKKLDNQWQFIKKIN